MGHEMNLLKVAWEMKAIITETGTLIKLNGTIEGNYKKYIEVN